MSDGHRSSRPRVVLVGAGHAHLHLAARAGEYRKRGAELILVDPGCFWYSGMATGMLGGRYPPRLVQVDPAALIDQAGGTFVAGQVVAIDVKRRQLDLHDGSRIDYDWLSMNIGSVVRIPAPLDCRTAGATWPVKPISGLRRLRGEVRARTGSPQDSLALTVVGGGATGSEVAANLAAALRARPGQWTLDLCSRGSRLLASAPRGASHALEAHLRRLGVRLHLGCEASRRSADRLLLSDGRDLRCDLLVVATGLAAPALTLQTGLPCDPVEGLSVGAGLQSVGDARVFAVGDCAHFLPRTLPKLGVFGVRAAPVLHENLLASIEGRPLRAYHPQRSHLSILDLGDGNALAIRGRLWTLGRHAMWLKRRIDVRFVGRYPRPEVSAP